MQAKFSSTLLVLSLALSCCVTTPAGPAIPPADMSLLDAAQNGNVSGIATALDQGAQIDRLHSGMTPLMWAVYSRHPDVVKLLLDRGANVQTATGQEITALSYAAMGRHTAIAKMLIAKGADIQISIDGLERLASSNAPYATTDNPANLKTFSEANSGIKMLEGLLRAKEPSISASPSVQPIESTLAALLPNYANATAVDDYAVVIGIENYADLPAATYAERDATAVRNFIRAMGVPERNIVLMTGSRATKSGLEKTIEDWLPNNVSAKSRVYFYYSGHGAPDAKSGGAYLLPSDGDPQYLSRTGYPLKQLYFQLGQLKAKSVLVALDSCFSGAGGRSVLAKGTRPLVGKIDMSVQPEGKVSVISASAGDQISGSNDEAGYGLFTYNLLQGLNGGAKNSQGEVTLKSLYSYLKPHVQDDARRSNRDQTPQLQSGGGEDLVLRTK